VNVILFLISSTMQCGDYVRKVVASLALMREGESISKKKGNKLAWRSHQSDDDLSRITRLGHEREKIRGCSRIIVLSALTVGFGARRNGFMNELFMTTGHQFWLQ